MQYRRGKDKVTSVTGGTRGCRFQIQTRQLTRSEFFFVELGFFDVHVFEFTRVEDLATLETFDEFTFFVAGDNSNARVPTFSHGYSLRGNLRRRGSRSYSPGAIRRGRCRVKLPEIGGILSLVACACQVPPQEFPEACATL